MGDENFGQKAALPSPDKLISLAEAARYTGVDASRLRRRAKLGLLDADQVGRTHVTTLRRLVASWDRRGERGPAPGPLPDAIILHVHRQSQRRD